MDSLSEMTDNVSSGTFNTTHSLTHSHFALVFSLARKAVIDLSFSSGPWWLVIYRRFICPHTSN